MPRIFISHTKKDKEMCDSFDTIVARVAIGAFRSEFEDISIPAWKTIKDELEKSSAVFFLVGKELVKNQELRETEWTYTQNWISYEMGLACARNIDVWVICSEVVINFPVPYLNNYVPSKISDPVTFNYLRKALEAYKSGSHFAYPYLSKGRIPLGIECPHDDCGIGFNLHARFIRGSKVTCPQCLKEIDLPDGHLV